MNTKNGTYGTEPPPDTAAKGWRRLRSGLVKRTSAIVMPIAQRVARDHFGGETVDDAICVAQRFATDGYPNTLGFWPVGTESARDMTDQYIASIDALAASGLDGHLSVKPPAVLFDPELAREIAEHARARNVGLHCDSHGIESVDPTRDMAECMLAHLSPANVGTTLPGRWRRSVEDADWAIERGLRVRVVKGQWPDPADPERDMGLGCLEVIDRLAGRAHHVAMASHDLPLLMEAIARLRQAGTDCEIQLIFGMPIAPILLWAKSNGVPVRIYIPYGKGFIPNAIGTLRRNPRLALRMLKGMVTRDEGGAPS